MLIYNLQIKYPFGGSDDHGPNGAEIDEGALAGNALFSLTLHYALVSRIGVGSRSQRVKSIKINLNRVLTIVLRLVVVS